MQITWRVKVNLFTNDITTQGHATSHTTTLDFNANNHIYGIYIPVLINNAPLKN